MECTVRYRTCVNIAFTILISLLRGFETHAKPAGTS
jgi:hypothetical protein